MAALTPTGHVGTVVWLGRVADRRGTLRAQPTDTLVLTFAGPEGEAHAGLTRPACSRVSQLYPRGAEIRNVRQLSLLSAEELAGIAQAMGIARLDPALLGASAVIAGIPDFTHLPPSSRLQGEDGSAVVVDMENLPCQLPAGEIEREAPGRGGAFRPAASGRRGVTGWVEREGVWRLGGTVRLHVPAQRSWAP